MDDSNQNSAPAVDSGIEIRVPKLPESVADATLIAWHKKPGDAVRRDENLVDIETDKVVFEVPAPSDGILRRIERNNGDTVLSEELLAFLEPGKIPKRSDGPSDSPAADDDAPSPPLSPAVRRLIDEHKLDPRLISASGKNGRPTKADVLAYLDDRNEQPSPPKVEPPPAAPARTPVVPPVAGDGVRRVGMSRLRQRIAERMVEAQHAAAILTTFNEVNMQAVIDLRRQYRERFEQQHGVKLGFMSFFIKACVEALQRFPIVNAAVEGGDVLYHDYYDISLAVSTPRGLVVPVLRDANHLSFAEIESGISKFAQRARDGDLTIEELTGGTFTITNGGVFGSLLSTPILNPPQSAILGMHKIEERPIAENGEVLIRPMMYLALSYDHRIIDGRDSVQFLVAIKELLEDPARLLLQV